MRRQTIAVHVVGFASDIVPGAGLAEVFDAREKVIRPVEKVQLLVEASTDLPDLAPRQAVNAEAFEEDFEPRNGAGYWRAFRTARLPWSRTPMAAAKRS